MGVAYKQKLQPCALFLALIVKDKVDLAHSSRLTTWVQQSPHTRLGLPFLSGMVLTLVVLTDVYKHRIETSDARKGVYDEREALGLGPKRAATDLREEYFVRSLLLLATDCADAGAQRLSLASERQMTDWDNRRVPRLPGQAEWGDVAEGVADIPGSRWQPGMKQAPPPEPSLRL